VAAPELFTFERVSVAGDGGLRILSDVSAGVPDGGITVVVGRSGSGKSTLLRLCNRLSVPASGRVSFRGADLAGLDPLQLRRIVGMVFQQPVPFGGSVRDNLRVAAPEARTDELLAALERAELPARFLDRPAADLSGGEAQRMCLARTLVTGPRVLLMDEPTSALDLGSTRAIERLARHLCQDGVPLLWVTHDLGQAMRLADWVVALAEGRLRWAGPRADLDGPLVARERVEAGERD
jgi:putative ABC transport system ATP-binding protein